MKACTAVPVHPPIGPLQCAALIVTLFIAPLAADRMQLPNWIARRHTNNRHELGTSSASKRIHSAIKWRIRKPFVFMMLTTTVVCVPRRFVPHDDCNVKCTHIIGIVALDAKPRAELLMATALSNGPQKCDPHMDDRIYFRPVISRSGQFCIVR